MTGQAVIAWATGHLTILAGRNWLNISADRLPLLRLRGDAALAEFHGFLLKFLADENPTVACTHLFRGLCITYDEGVHYVGINPLDTDNPVAEGVLQDLQHWLGYVCGMGDDPTYGLLHQLDIEPVGEMLRISLDADGERHSVLIGRGDGAAHDALLAAAAGTEQETVSGHNATISSVSEAMLSVLLHNNADTLHFGLSRSSSARLALRLASFRQPDR